MVASGYIPYTPTNCFDHGVGIIKCALGEDFSATGKSPDARAFIGEIARIFKNRRILVWNNLDVRKRFPRNVEYMGDVDSIFVDDPWNYIWCSLVLTDEGHLHMIVGGPIGKNRTVVACAISTLA